MKQKHVTVFGGSAPRPGTPAYEDALRLGGQLGKAGYRVLTGGYIGTMEAVSRGAVEGGGHVIGVTCDEIEVWRPVGPNRWVTEERRFPTTRQRLFELVEGCDAALALPGGIGTLAEISMMWSLLQTGSITPRPLILIGGGWQAIFDVFFETMSAYVRPIDRNLLMLVPDTQAAVIQLEIVFNPSGPHSRKESR